MLAVTTAERPRHDARRREDIPGARRQPPEQAARPAPVSQVTFNLPPHLLAALVPLLVLLVALDVYCLVDLARAKSMGGAAKLAWAVVVVFVSAPSARCSTCSSAGTAGGGGRPPRGRGTAAPTLAPTATAVTQAPARRRETVRRR